MKKRMALSMVISVIVVLVLLLAGCARSPAETSTSGPTETAPSEEAGGSPVDTTPPPAINNLTAAGGTDGKVTLNWDKSTAVDFHHYNMYISQSMITDVTGMTPNDQIKEIGRNTY